MVDLLGKFFNRINIPPVHSAALGVAAGFYFLFNAHSGVIITCVFLLFVITCFFRVLSSLNEDSRQMRHAAVCSTAFVIGLFVGLCAADAGKGNVSFGIPHENVIAVEGKLLEDLRITSTGSVMASVSLRRCAGDRVRVSSAGEITVFFPRENANKLREFGRGTVIFAEGQLRFSDHGWSFNASSLHIVKPASAIEQMRTNIRNNLIERFGKKTWGGLSLALLFGIRDNLDTELTTIYRGAGLSYILALSGMHLAIIAALISFLLKKPLGLKACAITGAVIIILYCLFVGPMPSLNRAALMYILGVFAILFYLPKNAMSVLSLSFLIQIIVTPAAGNSLSFILSYLALVGILVAGKALSFLLAGKVPNFLLQPLSISAGAFTATAGVCSFTFGMIAPIGIIAGLFIVPLTTAFMIGSIIWLVLDFISLSFLFNMPLLVLYRLMEAIASVSGIIPGISASSALVLAVSVIILLVIIALEHKRRIALLKLEPFL